MKEICIADSINFKDEKFKLTKNKCRGYGLSVNTCKQNAITLKIR